MELRHLLYFKMVAEQLHFRKAAKQLFISQPPLSRQIRELEEELGAVLLERNNKRVLLTPAGVYFKQKVDQIFLLLNESCQVVRQLHENLSGELKIGYISSTYHANLLDTLQEMRQVFPFLTVKLYEIPTVKQVRALEEGKLDIGILRAPVNAENLKVTTLFTDPFVVVMHGGTSVQDTADLAAYLSGQPFIFFNQAYAPVYHEKMIEICRRMGFSPTITHEANTVHSIIRLVAHGAGVSILPAATTDQFPGLDLLFVPLTDSLVTTEVVLATRAEENEAVSWFRTRYSRFFA